MDYDGIIREYPAIAIDRFTPRIGVKYYFLTHAHSDHTQGLQDVHFRGQVHCSEGTAVLMRHKKVRGKPYFRHLKGQLTTHPLFQSFVLNTEEHGRLTVTFYPSNHCPGAVMILLEGKNGTVLHTGDMRAESDLLQTHLTELPLKNVKHLYLDTTFCTDHHREFITKKQSISLLFELIDSYPGNHHFFLDFWMYGYEEAWWKIASRYNTKIHVSEDRYQLYLALDKHLFTNILTTDETTTRFHSCHWKKSSCATHGADTINVQGQPIVGCRARPFGPDDYKMRTDLPKHANIKKEVIIPFSMHSSMLELVDFVKFIGPKRVTPIVAHGVKWDATARILKTLRSNGAYFEMESSSSGSSSSSFSVINSSVEHHQLSQQKDSLRSSASHQQSSLQSTTADENELPESEGPTSSIENQCQNIVNILVRSKSSDGVEHDQSLLQANKTNDCASMKQRLCSVLSVSSQSSLEFFSGSIQQLPAASAESAAAVAAAEPVIATTPPPTQAEKPSTKYDRAAASWRASILNRKRPRNSTLDTLSWDGSFNFEEIDLTAASDRHVPKRTLSPMNGTTTAWHKNNKLTACKPVVEQNTRSGTTIENPICID
ncbi:beta-lactamase-like protein [Zychaea mexicana]|uniref:beta-lactamase-like protein n=1 Tax=Zychaea mexicana TaxID=64656 RepID=UPI0022FEC23F|nr:beta-lactamase-like protein [Zychaea mexicana]KAI9491333.1 beta-lactamase-like protein [Zychaea mexicana]